MRFYLIFFILVLGCSNPEFLPYIGTLESPGGPILFQFFASPGWNEGFIVNDRDTLQFSEITQEGDSLRFSILNFDSHLLAKIGDDGQLSGRWYKTASKGSIQTLPFSAEPGNYPKQSLENGQFDGEWNTMFTDADGSFPATGIFSFNDGQLKGTFVTETGDYRFLEGFARQDTLVLSTFDGAHAFYFEAVLNTQGHLEGGFWSSEHYYADWTAERGTHNLRNPGNITSIVGKPPKIEFEFPDTDGNRVSNADFEGKPILLYVFGSWCPNCADEARMLRQLWDDYRQTDLQIVGVAFEYTGDFSRDAAMVEQYRKRFDIPWTMLVGGISDKNSAAEKLPFVEEIVSFPTSFFADKNHIIQFTHTGFMGPGTGTYYDLEIKRFRQHINEITN
jgi:thiol-disulfide isomerase/thioredoxin